MSSVHYREGCHTVPSVVADQCQKYIYIYIHVYACQNGSLHCLTNVCVCVEDYVGGTQLELHIWLTQCTGEVSVA